MHCLAPCFNCPFRRDTDAGIKGYDDPFEFIYEHLTEDGGYKLWHCEEQDGICFGQIKHFANWNAVIMMDPFSELYEWVDKMEIDRENYFWMPTELSAYHRDGYIYGMRWWIEDQKRFSPTRPTRGTSQDSVPSQGDLFK